jgi:hypothetical protein
MKPKQLVVILSSICVGLLTQCSNQEITFSEHIAPIIHQNCSPCHHQKGAGPFNLITYQQVSRKAKTVAKVTKLRYMPPWPADPNYSHFKDEKYLTDVQIELIQKWVKSGKLPGDTAHITYPTFNYYSNLGEPDKIINLPEISINGNSRDQFWLVKSLGKITQDTFVKAIEFVPDQKAYIHHVNGYLLNYSQEPVKTSNRLVDIESKDYENEVKSLKLMDMPSDQVQKVHSAFNYLPGVFASSYPEGIGGFKISKDFALVCNDLHFGPSFQDTMDHSQIYIYFSKTKPKRPTREIMMGTNGVSAIKPPLKIQPNEVKTCMSSLYIPESISVLSINPHMHLIGTSFKAYAVQPNKDTIPLIYIPSWDFRWQYFYTFLKMKKIPAGSTIQLEAVFDNTINNPLNPFDPPQLIQERTDLFGAGMRTTDEMLQFIITYLPYEVGDEDIEL